MTDDKKTIKISTRFSLYISIFFLIGIVIVIVLVNFYMRRQALVEAGSKAIEILNNRLAIHTYFTHQLKPKMFQFTESFRPKDYFDPTWMSSTYAVREMGKYANQLGNKNYYYKECAINARSPENEADDYEREFLIKLEEEADLVSHSSIRDFAGKPYFAVLRRGEAMEESCLRCHSDPQNAPKGLIDIYGPERSFHRKVGDVVQAISIRIPLSVAYASANRFSFELSGFLLVLFGLLFLAHYYSSRRWVFNPLDAIREKTWLIAHTKEHLGEKIDIPKGREMKDLAVAFNTLSENLREHTDHLEDVVEKRTQQIKEGEKRFRLLFENAPLGYQSLDENGRFIEVNRAWLDLFGYQREEVIGRSFGDFVHPDWQDYFKENFPTFKSIGEILGIEFEMVQRDGTLFTVSIDGKIAKDEKGRFLRTHCILTDITERKKAEKKLVALSSRQEAILSAIPDIIMEVDQNKIYTWANPAGFDFFGDDVIGKEAADYFEGEQEIYNTVQPLFNGDDSVIYVESWQRRKDGQKRLLAWWCRVLKESSGTVSGALSTARDITEKEMLERQLQQAQKMESVGRLAGGVAHDFNNMLGVIIGHAELAMDQLDPAVPVHANLKEIHKAARHSADLTRQLLGFARKQTAAPKILDLNDTITGMLRMLRRLIGEDIDLAWLPDTHLWQVKIDPAQIDQILANLCVNARDAIAGVGKVTIGTQNLTLDEDYCANHAGFIPGDFAMLAVSDDGSGMDEKTLENIFEPFFTTKGVGEGSGLGLSTIYGIVKQNEGFINVYSEPGQGTTFKIYLPRTQETVEANKDPVTKKAITKGTETVLLVEDEESILKLSKTVLERFGYTVLSAQSPDEAISKADGYENPIHILVTDVVMPEMDGKTLKQRIKEIKPNIKVLFMSGYTANVIMHRGILESDVHFLQKPFSINSLAAKVRDILDETKQ